MKWSSISVGIFIASIIFMAFSISINFQQTTLYKENHYITPHNELHLNLVDFGGEIKVRFEITVGDGNSSKNISIYFDGKKIPTDEWFSTGHIGVHTLIVNSTNPVNINIYIYSRGINPFIPISFGTIAGISVSLVIINDLKVKKSHR